MSHIPQPQQQPMQPLPPPPQFVAPQKQKRFGWLALILTGVICLGVGGAVGGSNDPAGTTAISAPTATVTVTEPAGGGAPTTTKPKPTPTTAAYNPQPKDFRVGLKITEKKCYGSAGCNITYKVKLDYLGGQDLPPTGTTEITYEITGAEDPITGTLEVDGEGMFEADEEYASTAGSSRKLAAKVTAVEYNKYG